VKYIFVAFEAQGTSRIQMRTDANGGYQIHELELHESVICLAANDKYLLAATRSTSLILIGIDEEEERLERMATLPTSIDGQLTEIALGGQNYVALVSPHKLVLSKIV
jgi:hypothetical protein